jgi:hypothetical protein
MLTAVVFILHYQDRPAEEVQPFPKKLHTAILL